MENNFTELVDNLTDNEKQTLYDYLKLFKTSILSNSGKKSLQGLIDEIEDAIEN